MKHAVREIGRWGLTLHIYLSMMGFLLVLFFALTGITLNHENFGLDAPRVTASRVSLPITLVQSDDGGLIAATLRSRLHVNGPASNYSVRADEIDVTFSAPGRRTQAIINRTTGVVEVTTESHGLMGRIGDLHRGSESGAVWKGLIDITAVLLIASALTGIVTLVALPRRRRVGITAGFAAAIVIAVIYFAFVP